MIIIDPILDGSKFKNKTYTEPVRIQINRESIEHAPFPRVAFNSISFENCIFNSEVSISTNGELPKGFSILFTGCFIQSFESLIEQPKINLVFSSSYIQHFISRSTLDSILFLNCLGTYFIENCTNLSIKFETDSIRYSVWRRLNRALKDIFSIKTSFNLEKNLNTYIYFNPDFFKLSYEQGRIASELMEQIEDYKIKYLPSISELERLNISIDLKYRENIEHINTDVINARLFNLSVSGTLEGKLNVDNARIDRIFIRNLNPKGIFNLVNVSRNSPDFEYGKFEINNSNLKNTWFYGVRFDTYNSIAFYKTSFSEAKITSSVFPKLKKLNQQIKSLKNIHKDEKTSNFYREQYDLFLELKQLFEKGGNMYEAQKMKAVAYNALKNIKETDRWNDKFILGLNNWSNRHGTSPWLAFGWLVGFVVILHTFNIFSFESIYFDLDSVNTIRIIEENLHFITVIANPVHRISELGPLEEITGFTYFVSFISRIVVGFLYYQFIAAFRKFGKL